MPFTALYYLSGKTTSDRRMRTARNCSSHSFLLHPHGPFELNTCQRVLLQKGRRGRVRELFDTTQKEGSLFSHQLPMNFGDP